MKKNTTKCEDLLFFRKIAFISALLVLLPLLLSGCGSNQPKAYEKALSLFAKADYENAANAFEKLSGYAQSDTYAAYCHGLILYQQGDYSGAAFYFEKTQGFMYGTDRYNYCRAMQLCEEGDFASAKKLFEKLSESDYEDAKQQAAYCDACLASLDGDYERALISLENAGDIRDAKEQLLNLRMQVYNFAISKREDGDYSQAIALFNALGDYLSSADMAIACKELQREEQYSKAEELLSSGDTEGAYYAFSSLGSWRDSANRTEELAKQLGIHSEE